MDIFPRSDLFCQTGFTNIINNTNIPQKHKTLELLSILYANIWTKYITIIPL